MQKQVLLTFTFSFIFSTAFGAGPVTHIYLAERFLQASGFTYDSNQKQALILGTLFPDVRYVDPSVSRESTHEQGITLQNLRECNDPFSVGKKLHAFVDETRERFAVATGVYDALTDIPQNVKATFLKLIEDQVIYSRINVSEVLIFLGKFDEGEKTSGIREESLAMWHTFLSMYLNGGPLTTISLLAAFQKGYANISPQTLEMWSVILPNFLQDQKIKDYIEAMIAEFDRIFNTPV
jgi:hypothetical protein